LFVDAPPDGLGAPLHRQVVLMLSRPRTDGSSYCAADLAGVVNVCSGVAPKPSARTNARRSAPLQRTITWSATSGSDSNLCHRRPPACALLDGELNPGAALARRPKIPSFTVASDAKSSQPQTRYLSPITG